MSKARLTARMREIGEETLRVLAAVQLYQERMGYVPTLRELAEVTGLSHACTRYHLERLQRSGRLRQEPFHARAYRVVHRLRPQRLQEYAPDLVLPERPETH